MNPSSWFAVSLERSGGKQPAAKKISNISFCVILTWLKSKTQLENDMLKRLVVCGLTAFMLAMPVSLTADVIDIGYSPPSIELLDIRFEPETLAVDETLTAIADPTFLTYTGNGPVTSHFASIEAHGIYRQTGAMEGPGYSLIVSSG